MDVVSEMSSIIGYNLPTKFGERRKGDAVYSVADNSKFLKKFSWKPKYNNLKIILESALNWEKSLSKMNNIIITPAVGMPPNDIILFLSSLRRFYEGEVLFCWKK